MVCRGATYVLLAVTASVGFSFRASDGAEATVFARERPIDVSWGEVAIVETTRVDAPFKKGRVRFPNALGLEFTLRRRTEIERPDGSGIEVNLQSETVASFWIAAEIEDGDSAWRIYRDALVSAVTQLRPSGYERFLNRVGTLADLLGNKAFRYVACVSRAATDVAMYGFSQHNPGSGISAASSNLNDPAPICAALSGALRYAPKAELVTSSVNVYSAERQRVRVSWGDGANDGFATLPRGASVERRLPDPGTVSYSSSGGENGSTSDHEQLIAEADESGSVVLVAHAPDAEIDPTITRRRGLLARWFIETTRAVFGAQPIEMPREEPAAFSGFFFLSEPARFDMGVFLAGVGRELASRDNDLAADLVVALGHSVPEPSLASTMVITCRVNGQNGFKADYCIAHACGHVTNPSPVCEEIRRELTTSGD